MENIGSAISLAAFVVSIQIIAHGISAFHNAKRIEAGLDRLSAAIKHLEEA